MTKRSSGSAIYPPPTSMEKRNTTPSPRDFSEFSKALGGAFKPKPALEAALMAVKKLVRRR